MAENIAIQATGGDGGGLMRAGNWLLALLRRWRTRPVRQLRLCETLALGERRFLAVVEFGPHKFLIGGTGNSVVMLARLPATAEAEPLSESADLRSPAEARVEKGERRIA